MPSAHQRIVETYGACRIAADCKRLVEGALLVASRRVTPFDLHDTVGPEERSGREGLRSGRITNEACWIANETVRCHFECPREHERDRKPEHRKTDEERYGPRRRA